ncbi:MAG: hypothetical protein R3320_04355 [Nitriliruptorales bacterium]|nr:hypothetical protein [Nitriliruptorales bacterium]
MADEPRDLDASSDHLDPDDVETERELRQLREELDIPSRGAGVYVMLSILASFAAVWGVWPILTGPAGMVLGLIGHLKGHRRGFAAAVIAGVAMIIGLSVNWLLFSPFESG